jgi:superfamily I DNA/RNA helicase
MSIQLHPSVAERLDRLAPDQRAAATAEPGPVLCVAPAGSGKTTTLVARVAWLVDQGADAAAVTVVAFNRRAAEELTVRLEAALAPIGSQPVRVRTFHALGREVLAETGIAVEPLVDRETLLRSLFPESTPADRGRLDLAFSRLKLDLRVTADEVVRDPAPGPIARAFVAYERAIAETGGLDFDDLIARTIALLREDPATLQTWRARCEHLLVDEAQDLDRSQLELVLLLAAPANRVFLVGDDDQTIYGWRLADVRRVLGLAASLPGLRRVDLEVNYRCPRPVVERAVRLVAHNRERFAKRIRAGPAARGRLVLAPDGSDDLVRITRAMRSWPPAGGTRAVLARTNRELRTVIVAAVELGLPFRAPDLTLIIEDPRLDALLARADAIASEASVASPLLTLDRLRVEVEANERAANGSTAGRRAAADVASADPDRSAGQRPGRAMIDVADVPGVADPTAGGPDDVPRSELVGALLGWAPRYPTITALREAVEATRSRLRELRSDEAALTLATAHGTKGLEWDHVVVLADGFPGRRSVSDATEPERALEEERRLAYVAWTRARRSLTLLFDPDSPSQFLLEAFTPDELGLSEEAAAA